MSEDENVPQTRSLFAGQRNPVDTGSTDPVETEEAAAEEQVAVAEEQTEATVETEAPAVDNDHVEEGATQFTDEEVALNSDEVEAAPEQEASDESPEAEETADQTVTEASDEPDVTNESEQAPDVAAKIDTSDEIASLEAEQKRIQDQLDERKKAQHENVIQQIKSVVDTYGISVADLVQALGGLKRKGSPVKAKYKDPTTGATWSGRGKPPLWIKDQDRTKFLITE